MGFLSKFSAPCLVHFHTQHSFIENGMNSSIYDKLDSGKIPLGIRFSLIKKKIIQSMETVLAFGFLNSKFLDSVYLHELKLIWHQRRWKSIKQNRIFKVE